MICRTRVSAPPLLSTPTGNQQPPTGDTMIKKLTGERDGFVLHTENTSYAFAVTPSGHPMHIWYGPRIDIASIDDVEVMRQKCEFEPGTSIAYSEEHKTTVLEDMCLEMSGPGHGDIREPFIELVRADGSRTTDFLYQGCEIDDNKPGSGELPGSFSPDGKYEHLCVRLRDAELILELHYCVYPECDVITRSARLINEGKEPVELERLMSVQLDLPSSGWEISSFHGTWTREMEKSSLVLSHGKYVIESRAGCSSNRANPFFMLHESSATEDHGAVYGFNLIYSGNHYAAIEVNAYQKTRAVQGINPFGFRFVLDGGESFEAPEAVMTFSDKGFTGQSRNMHRFVKDHIIRGEWAKKERPILLNSWEASYFNISESNLVSLAKSGRDLGIELFVMDDGWFGERSDDTRALGDWDCNRKKLPGGISRLSKKITALGLSFGLWIEPEMINVDSRLYESHPDWALAIPGRLHSEGRHQRILDLCNPEVVIYLEDKMTEVLSSGEITYIKWDMNRIFSDAFSPYLPANRQGEVFHRYILGLYRLMKTLTARFPDILFEGCASGGNRFDLGALCYFPQIWASDDTDAVPRAHIQEGYSYGYPQCCVSAHVSACPNHQTMRTTPLETRFNVAAFGVLGYELNISELSSEQKEHIRLQITLYKVWREVLQFGDQYRVSTGNIHEWMCVSPDKKLAVGMFLQELTQPNTQTHIFRAKGLDPELTYRLHNISGKVNIKLFGSLINTMSPIHIKQNGFIHNILARFVKMGGEVEDYTAKGSVLTGPGVGLKPQYAGTGYNENVRLFPDFSSRMYFIEAID